MKKQILVVEDNEINRAILFGILSEEYRVLEAENGQVALELLRQNKDSIALILLDVIMPVMDGYTFLDRIRGDKELSLIPVIVTTQSDGESDEVSALAHGATDFVPKPYRPQVILHRVAGIIRLRETAAMVNQFQFDRLTGLYSKEFFYQKVRERLDENPDREYCITCSNIENFKLYNDIFGREAGDRLLRESAEIMRRRVSRDAICGRYGADCFLCLQEREKELADRQAFTQAMSPGSVKKMTNVSVRWGIYEITDRSVPIEQMCDRALLAANSIKGQYNRFFAVYDDSLRNKLLRNKAITDAMETALSEGQFQVYLQPKYRLNGSRIAGAEALVRWIHPQWGIISPGEFIPLFEKNGFISRLDRYVWERVCGLLKSWRDRGLPTLPVSVNISRVDVYQADLVGILRELTEKYGVEPSSLHLEITESAYAENPGTIISTIAELRALGFVVEMDDFGSGYSSLNMLSQMKLDILKLDMKFIQNEIAKSEELSILSDIITMAHRVCLSVVAEGVETAEQAERLRAVGCDYVQGFYFAKPMPVAEYEQLLGAVSPVGEAPEQPEPAEETVRECLLIADENAEYRANVCNLFAAEYRVVEADSADAATDLLRSRKDISCVILSVTLPGDGAASVLKLMRQDPVFWGIPVLTTVPNGEYMAKQSPSLETDDFICKLHPLFDVQRRVRRLLDLAATRKKQSSLEDQANHDFLTGLYNRRGLTQAADALRNEDRPLALYLFDLDELKGFNDSHGHIEGDRMIRGFADLLRSRTRKDDILCRYGGDEFLVIMKRVDDAATAVARGEDICAAFRASFAGKTSCSCSAGVALCKTDEPLSANTVGNADRALYRAKLENKGGCCLWKDEA